MHTLELTHTCTDACAYIIDLTHTRIILTGIPGCIALLLCHDDTYYDTNRDPPAFHDNSSNPTDTGSGPKRYTFSQAVAKIVATAKDCRDRVYGRVEASPAMGGVLTVTLSPSQLCCVTTDSNGLVTKWDGPLRGYDMNGWTRISKTQFVRP